MPRYKLTLAYEGTDFCGWQKQFPHADAVSEALRMERHDESAFPPALRSSVNVPHNSRGLSTEPELPQDRPRVELRTVQSVLERATRQVVHQPVVIHGASRTDSGVHARGQVAAFSTVVEDDARGRGGWPLERGATGLMRAINSRLPRDVLVMNAEVVADDFNPIGGALSKGYSYTIWSSRERTLWERRTSLHIWHSLEVERMKAAAAVLVGEHDFAAFAAAGHGRATTVRSIHDCQVELVPPVVSGSPSQREGAGGRVLGRDGSVEWQPSSSAAAPMDTGSSAVRPQMIRINVSGSGFLWNMVRIIAGTLVEAGKSRIPPEQVRDALATGDRRKAGPTLPPQGLCLEWIRYDH